MVSQDNQSIPCIVSLYVPMIGQPLPTASADGQCRKRSKHKHEDYKNDADCIEADNQPLVARRLAYR